MISPFQSCCSLIVCLLFLFFRTSAPLSTVSKQLLSFGKEIAAGLAYLQGQKFVHRVSDVASNKIYGLPIVLHGFSDFKSDSFSFARAHHGQQCHDTHTLALLHFLTGQPVVALSLFPMSLYVSEFQPSAAALSTSITSLPMTKY